MGKAGIELAKDAVEILTERRGMLDLENCQEIHIR